MKKVFIQMRNEWRGNLWLMFELLLVSVVLWFCLDYLVEDFMIRTEPRGHDIRHTYLVRFGSNGIDSDRPAVEEIDEFVNRIRRRPEVEVAALSHNSIPYTGSMSNARMWDQDTINPVFVTGIHRYVQSDFFRVFRLRGVRGESPEQLAEILRPGINVVGVTGKALVDSLGRPVNAVNLIGHLFNLNGWRDHTLAVVTEPMKRFDSDALSSPWGGTGLFDMMSYPALPSANELSVRVYEDMDDGSFAEKLMLNAESINVGRYFIMNVNSFDDIRRCAQAAWNSERRNMVTGLVFLIVNIFLCLLGTFWFRTQQRTCEIAVHKINGATSTQIMWRLVGEGLILLLLVTPLAIATDWLLVNVGMVPNSTFSMTQHMLVAAGTTLLMVVMIAVGIWFPAYRARRISPALALKSE